MASIKYVTSEKITIDSDQILYWEGRTTFGKGSIIVNGQRLEYGELDKDGERSLNTGDVVQIFEMKVGFG